jgi:hypothetical protein
LQIYYKLTINLTKASIVLLYHRIFTPRPFRFACIILIGTIGIFMVTLTGLTVFQCQPVNKSWIRNAPGTCLDHLMLWRVNAIYNIMSDIIIILLPFPVLRSLGLPTAQFLGLALIICCGIFVIVTAILRYTTLDAAGHAPDPTAGTLTSTVWTQAEAFVAVVCACLPMLRVLLQRWLPCLKTMSNRHTRSIGTGEASIEAADLEHLANSGAPAPCVPQVPPPHRLSARLHDLEVLDSSGKAVHANSNGRGVVVYT